MERKAKIVIRATTASYMSSLIATHNHDCFTEFILEDVIKAGTLGKSQYFDTLGSSPHCIIKGKILYGE